MAEPGFIAPEATSRRTFSSICFQRGTASDGSTKRPRLILSPGEGLVHELPVLHDDVEVERVTRGERDTGGRRAVPAETRERVRVASARVDIEMSPRVLALVGHPRASRAAPDRERVRVHPQDRQAHGDVLGHVAHVVHGLRLLRALQGLEPLRDREAGKDSDDRYCDRDLDEGEAGRRSTFTQHYYRNVARARLSRAPKRNSKLLGRSPPRQEPVLRLSASKARRSDKNFGRRSEEQTSE